MSSLSSSRPTTLRAKLLLITPRSYAAGAAMEFDDVDARIVIHNGIHLNPAHTALITPAAGNYRIEILTHATSGVSGKSFSIVTVPESGAPPTVLFAGAPFGSHFAESYLLEAQTSVQLRFEAPVTLTAADTNIWFELSA